MIREDILKKIDDCIESKILNLANLHISDDEIVEVMQYAREKKSDISFINLKNNKLTDVGALKLRDILKDYARITQLNIEFNYLGREGIQELSFLRFKHKDIQLFFHGNDITNVAQMGEIMSIRKPG